MLYVCNFHPIAYILQNINIKQQDMHMYNEIWIAFSWSAEQKSKCIF